jgi:Mg-chelatase subunit ChlD
MAILLCVLMVVFLATVAFAVDVAYMKLVKSELQSATDAAAKSTAEALARTQSISQAVARGKEIASRNLVANSGLILDDSNFEFGNSTRNGEGKFVFTSRTNPINSVRIEGKRSRNSLSGGVRLFFGRMFNVTEFEPEETATATFLERDIVLIVDRSSSMLEDDKFLGLKSAVATFTQTLRVGPIRSHVGLASYAEKSKEELQLTTDLDAFDAIMAAMTIDDGTNIKEGINSGAKVLLRGRDAHFVERTIILLTDGLENCDVGQAYPAAQNLAKENVAINTISFGADADQSLMKSISKVGKGRHFHAPDNATLADVFHEIAMSFHTMITE